MGMGEEAQQSKGLEIGDIQGHLDTSIQPADRGRNRIGGGGGPVKGFLGLGHFYSHSVSQKLVIWPAILTSRKLETVPSG